MQLVADRVAVSIAGRAIDLSNGEEVTMITASAGSRSEQVRWASRCDALSRLRHGALAPLIDYGALGEARRFEVWGCGPSWRGARERAARTAAAAGAFLQALGLCRAEAREGDVRTRAGRPVVLPGAGAGFEAADATRSAVPLEACGISLVARPAVAAMAEILAGPVGVRPLAIAIWGPCGSGVRTAVGQVARLARASGYVPLATHLADSRMVALIEGRSILLIEQSLEPDAACRGWRRLMETALRSPRAHVLLIACREEIRGVPSLRLDPLSPAALAAAVVPEDRSRDRVERAARRSRGIPGRFVRLVWGTDGLGASGQSQPPRVPARAAESRALYGEVEDQAQAPSPAAARLTLAQAADLEPLRRRMAIAADQIDRGRHAPGERGLRAAVAGLARRRDWVHAARGALVLARSIVSRGRPAEGQAVLADAREYADRSGHDTLIADVAVASGSALTDLARLDEAEQVLRAVVEAGPFREDPGPTVEGRFALSRTLFWRGRYRDAEAILGAIDAPATDPTGIRLAIAGARVAVGLRDLGTAVARATGALEAAERLGDPTLLARAACAAAFAHLAVGDRLALERDTVQCLRAARAARDPLRAIKVRLLAVEAARRRGQCGPAAALVSRVGKLATAHVPATVRARCALLRDLLSGAANKTAVRRHAAATGLDALALFTPAAGAFTAVIQAAADDFVEILRCCQTAPDEGVALREVCARLQVRLEAAGVAVFAPDRGAMALLASSGGRVEAAIADRILAAGQAIAPHAREGVIAGGAPVRYGGDTLGFVVARWTAASPPDPASASLVLTMAATAAAPAVAEAVARRAAGRTPAVPELLGVSAAIAEVRASVERAAPAPFAVLIEGESGSGKELVARALHRRSDRHGRPFCTLNCAALPDDLVEAELFGHARGAFTGAVAERPGVFEEAHTGTLLLDEIGELSPRAQAKLLRTIQEGELRRVGENVSRRIDVRIVSATNRDLRQEAAAGRFRHDLLYRLDVIRITVPPLRERRDDVSLLVEHAWRAATERVGSRAVLGAAIVAALVQYDWPGNVRELQNVLAALAVRAPRRGVVPPAALPPPFLESRSGDAWRLAEARRTFEERFVRAALVRSGGHRARAAAELGVTRQGLTKLIARLGLAESAPG